MVEDLIKDEVKSVMAQCYTSTRTTAKVLFPNRFNLPFSPLHVPIFEAIDNDDKQLVVIAAPRGIGKTSTVNLAYPAKKILFREKKFIVPISSTATQAVMQSENLKRELLTNPAICEIFGPMKSDSFSKDQWITTSGTMVLPRGSGQQVRGILFGDFRPDLIIIDDLENPEDVKNEDSRKKLKEWFFADVMNSVNRSLKNWKIVVIGTLLHEDSLLANLLEDKNWNPIILSLCDDDYNSNWPDFMSNEDVRKLADSYRKQGMLDVFYREYRNIAISTEDAVFMAKYFQYHNEAELSLDKNIENIVIVDPAKTVKLHSAESAVIGIGLNLITGKIHQRDLIAKKMHPDELYDAMFGMCQALNAKVLGVEVTSLNEFITYPIKNEIISKKMNLELVELNARGSKEERIASLVPLYRRGMITHNPANCGPLEAQLLSFPRSKRWDCMDAEAYVVEMMSIGERYFFPKTESKEAIDREMQEMMKDDYADIILGEDVPIEEINWRRI